MSMEISVKQFENNAKKLNKRGLNRSFKSMAQTPFEYVNATPLSATSDFVLEVSIDKEYAEDFQKFLKRKKYKVLGATNFYHIGKMIENYNMHQKAFSSLAEKMEAINKDYELMKKSKSKYNEIGNDDVKFYFSPYNDDCETIYDFIKNEKNSILKWCKKNDITIIINLIAYCDMAKGFLGFNFLDDQAEGEVIVDFVSNMQVSVNFKDRMSVYAAALLMSGIGKTEQELELVNCHIQAE